MEARLGRTAGAIGRRARLAAASLLLAAAAVVAASGAWSASTAKTIKIGLINDEGPVVSLPEFRYGAEAAANYINKHGGVHGAKIVFDECKATAAPDATVNCANQFVDNHDVAVFDGIDLSEDAALPIVDGANIPYIASEQWGTKSRTDANVWEFGAAGTAYFLAPLKNLANLKVKKIDAFAIDLPISHQLDALVTQPVSKKLGVTVKTIYFPASNANWSSVVATALTDKPQGLWGILQESDCIGMVKAARDAGFKGPIGAGSCTLYIQVLQKEALNTYTVGDTLIPAQKPYVSKTYWPQMALYNGAMNAIGKSKYTNGFAVTSFSDIWELAAILKHVKGAYTNVSVKAALQKYSKNVPGFLRPPLHCRRGVFTSEPTACRATLDVSKVEQDKKGNIIRVPTSKPLFLDVENLLPK